MTKKIKNLRELKEHELESQDENFKLKMDEFGRSHRLRFPIMFFEYAIKNDLFDLVTEADSDSDKYTLRFESIIPDKRNLEDCIYINEYTEIGNESNLDLGKVKDIIDYQFDVFIEKFMELEVSEIEPFLDFQCQINLMVKYKSPITYSSREVAFLYVIRVIHEKLFAYINTNKKKPDYKTNLKKVEALGEWINNHSEYLNSHDIKFKDLIDHYFHKHCSLNIDIKSTINQPPNLGIRWTEVEKHLKKLGEPFYKKKKRVQYLDEENLKKLYEAFQFTFSGHGFVRVNKPEGKIITNDLPKGAILHFAYLFWDEILNKNIELKSIAFFVMDYFEIFENDSPTSRMESYKKAKVKPEKYPPHLE